MKQNIIPMMADTLSKLVNAIKSDTTNLSNLTTLKSMLSKQLKVALA